MQTSCLRSLSRVNARIIRTQFTRFASTSETPVVVARPIKSGSTLKTTALVLGTGLFIAYYYDSRSAIHRWVIPPLMRVTLEPETAHRLALRVLRSPLAPKDQGKDDEALKCMVRFSTKLHICCHKRAYSRSGTFKCPARLALPPGSTRTEKQSMVRIISLTKYIISIDKKYKVYSNLGSTGSKSAASRLNHRYVLHTP